MIHTVQQIFEGTRALLGDTRTPGGARYTNQRLRSPAFAQAAYTELFSVLQNKAIDRTRQIRYPILPAYTSVLYPATAGINDFGDIITISERGFTAANSISITGVTPNAASGYCDVTVTSHPFSDGERITIAGVLGVSDDVNGLWMITKQDANTIRLNGCRATGTWTSGGVATYSNQDFLGNELQRVDQVEYSSDAPNATSLLSYEWSNDAWRFAGASEARQLEIVFRVSGSFPAGDADSVLVDDAGSYLIYRIASLAGLKDMPERAMRWEGIAIGPSRNVAQSIGGMLGSLIKSQVRDKQKIGPIQRPPFRPRRGLYAQGITGLGWPRGGY
jgi:hypothetical protein